MKSSLIVISALFASVSSMKLATTDEESINLQIGVEARARSNVREELRTNLRAFLESEEQKPQNIQNIQTEDYYGYQGEDQHGYGQWGNTGHKHIGGDSNWPAPILPGSEPVMPVKSSDPDVFVEPVKVEKKKEDKPKDKTFL